MLKTIIGKKKNPKAFQALGFFFFFPFKLKSRTQNPKIELKRFWIRLDSGTK